MIDHNLHALLNAYGMLMIHVEDGLFNEPDQQHATIDNYLKRIDGNILFTIFTDKP
jgi:hypothetical protein